MDWQQSRDEVAADGTAFDLATENGDPGLDSRTTASKDGNVQVILPLPLLENSFLSAIGGSGG
jgi:hypothetical protein